MALSKSVEEISIQSAFNLYFVIPHHYFILWYN
jgi:hypothetical protein